MISFVVFSVLGRKYGVSIENVKRILQAQELTQVPDEEEHIEGIFQYQGNVLKTLGFRKAIGEDGYEDELHKLFPSFKKEHNEWMNALEETINEKKIFEKNRNLHHCELGKWIDSFHPDDEEVLTVLKELIINIQHLYVTANKALDMIQNSRTEAKEIFENQLQDVSKKTMKSLDKVISLSSKIAAELQRCLIIEDNNAQAFGLNIDRVDGIIHVNEDEVHSVNEDQGLGDYMNVLGILTQEDTLITIIKDISLKKGSV